MNVRLRSLFDPSNFEMVERNYLNLYLRRFLSSFSHDSYSESFDFLFRVPVSQSTHVFKSLPTNWVFYRSRYYCNPYGMYYDFVLLLYSYFVLKFGVLQNRPVKSLICILRVRV